VTKYEYDDRNNLKSKTEGYCGCAGVVPGKTYYDYDGYGNMTSLVLPTGASMKMEYDSYGQLLFMKDGKGNVIQSYTYYDNGLVKTETDTSGTSQYVYDRYGNLSQSIDPDGSITRMGYDFNGNMKTMTEDKGTPDDVTDDEISTFSYDKLGRERLADYGDGIWVKYDYEGAGGDWSKLEAPTIGKMERKLTEDGKLAGWVTPSGGTPTFIYDSAGRLWRETDEAGVVTTEYSYDVLGRVSSVKDVRSGAVASKKYDAGNRVTEEIDPLLGFVKYEYYGARDGGKLKSTTRGQYVRNGAGELVVDTTIALQKTSYEYNGSRTTVIDPLGRRTTAVQDEYALPIETIFENRNGKDYKTSQSYLYANNLQEAKDYPTRTVDIGGNDRTYTYDSTGRLKTATDLGDGIYSYSYGKNGLATIESPLSQTKNGAVKETIGYTYDDAGNLQSVKYSDLLARSMTYRSTDNRLGTVTLANGDNVAYDYNTAGQITSQTGTGVGTTTLTYTADGAIKTVTDRTGTTTYSYDPLTNQLSQIENSNGSSIAYTYDIAGRIKTQTERGSRGSTGYTTEYTYDTFGNLKTVKDPAGGITTMNYDVLNRLKERNLPNGMKSTWEYDDLDRIQSVTHKAANGTVVSSIVYERNASGEPNKITREDGTYRKLQYDTALRVTKESFYNAQNTLVDETSYVYDAAGKRLATVKNLDMQTYKYDKGYQLDSITGTNPEDYAYDANGRMDLIQRDGKTLDLDHDVYDRLTTVKNLTSATTTNYVYDGQGRRITSTTGNETRQFLIAPVMGGGLDSTDMMTDGSGNLTANYVYAGGYSPFMKLDGQGNPIYYLTDDMGSVIGLADQSGQNVSKFSYDSFGNIRNQSGTLADRTGGDFRFQGQWLESATGIYNFRARDYDSRTGTFLSRDPVDPNDQAPEALNPYQAMYNNAYVYSDPTGMFSIMELNAAESIQKGLDAAQKALYNNLRQDLVNKAKGIPGQIIQNLLPKLFPFNKGSSDLLDVMVERDGGKQGNKWQNLLSLNLCETISSTASTYLSNLWMEPAVDPNNGNPVRDGYGCDVSIGLGAEKPVPDGIARPDFIIKRLGPASFDHAKNSKYPKAYLIGDIAYQLKTVVKKTQSSKGKNQINAIINYAATINNHQTTPIGLYVTLYGGSQSDLEKVMRKGISRGVALLVASIYPGAPN
jgi:RHS repeat-associated protein